MARMKDSNGIEMETGMIVEIKDAYFKNDNGLWFITDTPGPSGDPNWSGTDYCLHKLCKNGNPSKAKRHIAFWPLCSFCSDPTLNYDAKEHNEKFATITVRTDITREHIAEYFSEKAEGAQATLDWDTRMGHAPKVLAQEKAIVEHYKAVAEKCAA